MPFSGTSETWKRITTKYLVDLINQSQKDALKGGDVYDAGRMMSRLSFLLSRRDVKRRLRILVIIFDMQFHY